LEKLRVELKAELVEIRSRLAAQSLEDPVPESWVDDFLRTMEIKPITRRLVRTIPSVLGPEEQRALREAEIPLANVTEHLVRDAAPAILDQFRLFVQKRVKEK
jgi:hypothetical protein